MKTHILSAILLSLALSVFASAQNKSVYTDLTGARCKTIKSNPEEGGSYVGECKGIGGYRLQVVEGDLRQTVNVITPSKKKLELNLWRAFGGFSTVGPKAEWRMEKGVPVALIVRFMVSEIADQPEKITSYLIVSKVSTTAACIVGAVQPGKNQNIEARKLADAAPSKPCEEF